MIFCSRAQNQFFALESEFFSSLLRGVHNMVRLFELANTLDARVLLTGDSGQHGSVERGDAFRLLESHAGLESPIMTEIVRQQGEYAAASKDFAEQRPVEGFDKFETMGWVVEAPDEVRPLLIAQDYLWALNARKRTLIVAPTHAEGWKVTAAIRDLLKKDGKLGKDERQVYQLRNLHWTDAEKSDAAMYEIGQVVQFVQNAPGFVKGQRFTVVRGTDKVWLQNARGQDVVLPLHHTKAFQVYQTESMPLATGDLARTTAGGKTLDGGTIDNGCVARVTGFTVRGDIKLSNGKILPKDFGHLAPGYYITSWSGQSKTVDRVLIAEGAESFRAANLEQFYVSCTRGRESCRIYTDDKDALRERIVHSSQRGTATELMAGQVAANTRPRDVTARAMKDREALQRRVAYRRKHQAVAEAVRDGIGGGKWKREAQWYERIIPRQGPDYGR
jgi:hypothetical protein